MTDQQPVYVMYRRIDEGFIKDEIHGYALTYWGDYNFTLVDSLACGDTIEMLAEIAHRNFNDRRSQESLSPLWSIRYPVSDLDAVEIRPLPFTTRAEWEEKRSNRYRAPATPKEIQKLRECYRALKARVK